VATSDRFVAIGAGRHHTCALRADGRAVCWGYGAAQPWPAGGPLPVVRTPTVAATSEPFTALTVRGYQDCGLGASGATYCWGLDIPGTTGAATGLGQDTFARAAPPFTLRDVESGGYHLCGIATDGIAWCWGGPYVEPWGSGALSGAPRSGSAPVRVAGQ